MIKVTKSPSSITLRSTDTQTSITARIVAGVVEFHQSLNGKDGKHAVSVQNELVNIVKNKVDKKLGYAQRFTKVSNLIEAMEGATSFQKVKNRLEKAAL